MLTVLKQISPGQFRMKFEMITYNDFNPIVLATDSTRIQMINTQF